MSLVQTPELRKDALAEAQKIIEDGKGRDSYLKDGTEDVEGDDCSVKSLTEDEQETEHKPDADASAENHLEGRDAEKEPRPSSGGK